FLQRWNLLYLAAAVGVAVLTPSHIETVLALAAAGEITMLAGFVGSDRFRREINAQKGAEESKVSSAELTRRFNSLYMGLSKEAKMLFDQLKRRCEALRSTEFDTPDDRGIEKISESQLQGANR